MAWFEEKVYRKIKRIPRGRVSTYAAVAEAMGRAGSCRVVGNVLNKNKLFIKIPCHRVVRSDGSLGGFALGQRKKREFLEKEGIKIRNGKIVDFKKRLYKF